MSEPFSAGAFFRDSRFFASFAIAAAIAIGGIGFAIDNIANRKIKIDPIAKAEFLPEPKSERAKSIANLNEAVKNGTTPSTKDIWSGYAIDLAKVCGNRSPPQQTDAIVLFKTADGFNVGITELDSRTCALAGDLKRDEAIYAMSDSSDPKLASEKKFFVLNVQEAGSK